MTTVKEASAAPLEMAAGLETGLETLSKNQVITFTRYVRVVLPADGYVFWVKAELLSPGALYNVARINAARYNQTPTVTQPAAVIKAQGSLHYTSDLQQDEDRTSVVNTMIFTSEVEVNDLSAVGPNSMYVATFGEQRFAFRQSVKRYYQAGLWHYRGDALYSVMDTQLVDNPASLNTQDVIVSNSLPIWLALLGSSHYGPVPNPLLQLFPSHLVPQNEAPPFGAVHIEASTTRAMVTVPTLLPDMSHLQLASETVKFTMFGLRNAQALNFQDYLMQYCDESDLFGLMNMPVIRDEKLTQAELGIIAQKKSLTLEISYYQHTARELARQLIKSALIHLTLGG